jgi:hypothetical protein
VEFYSATKRNKILLFADKWIELENIILSEISHVQKAKGHMFFSLICGIQTQYKYEQYYTDKQIGTEHVPQGRTGRRG